MPEAVVVATLLRMDVPEEWIASPAASHTPPDNALISRWGCGREASKVRNNDGLWEVVDVVEISA